MISKELDHSETARPKQRWRQGSSSVARGGQEGAAAPPIIARDEYCNSPKSVEKLEGGGDRLHFSPTLVAA